MSALAPRMSAQQALPLPSPTPSNTVVINARCSLRTEADQRVIVVAGLPVHHYRAGDEVAEAYAMVFLVQSCFAQQTDVARAFDRSVRTIRRYQQRYVAGGMAALGREEGWRRGRRRISAQRLRSIEILKSQGMSNRAIVPCLVESGLIRISRRLYGDMGPAPRSIAPSSLARSLRACVSISAAISWGSCTLMAMCAPITVNARSPQLLTWHGAIWPCPLPPITGSTIALATRCW